jgi:hypothetical protein
MRELPLQLNAIMAVFISGIALLFILNGIAAIRRQVSPVLGYPRDVRIRGRYAIQSGIGLICMGISVLPSLLYLVHLPPNLVCVPFLISLLLSIAGVILHFRAAFRDPLLSERLRENPFSKKN